MNHEIFLHKSARQCAFPHHNPSLNYFHLIFTLLMRLDGVNILSKRNTLIFHYTHFPIQLEIVLENTQHETLKIHIHKNQIHSKVFSEQNLWTSRSSAATLIQTVWFPVWTKRLLYHITSCQRFIWNYICELFHSVFFCDFFCCVLHFASRFM